MPWPHTHTEEEAKTKQPKQLRPYHIDVEASTG